MTTSSQRIWEAIYAAALVRFACDESHDGGHTAGVPNVMIDAVKVADAHANFARYEPQSRFRKRSR